MPAELLLLWWRLQNDAARVAQDELAPLVAAIADDRTALTAAQTQLAVDQAALAGERVTTERVVDALREDFQSLQTRNDELLANIPEFEEGARRNHEEGRRRQQAIRRLEHELTEALRSREEAAASLTLAQAENAALANDVATARAQARATESEVMALQTAVTERSQALAMAEQRIDALTSQLASVRADVARQTGRGDRMEQALRVAEAAATSNTALRDHLAGELEREREALAGVRVAASRASGALAASEATVTVLTLEAARLHTLLHSAALAADPAANEPP